MPTCCERMSGRFCAGELSMSCDVIMLVDVPTIPLLRRVKLTSIAGRAICAREAEIDATSATTAPASLAICPSPMTHVLRLRSACVRTLRVKTKPVAKDANEADGVPPALHAECRGRFLSHGLRTGIAVTAAKDRSVWTPRPPVG